MDGQSLAGRRALVTGAGGGIGGAASMALAAAGAEVTLMGRSVAPLEAVAKRIRDAGGVATLCPGDVTDELSVEEALDPLPVHDVVVNAAGANKPQPFTDITLETFDSLFALNVRGLFIVTQHQVRRMLLEKRTGRHRQREQPDGARRRAEPVVYCGTKHAVEGFTKALGVELAPHGIRVVAVAPTWIETPFTKPFFEDAAFKASVLADLPIGRLGQPEDVAGAIVFLASDAASLITGTSLLIDGGWTAK